MIRSSYAFVNLVKATVGVGVFALPVAFKQAGLWTGLVLMLALGIVNAHSLIKIVHCSQYLCKKKQLKQRKFKLFKSKATIAPVDNPPEEITNGLSTVSKCDPEVQGTNKVNEENMECTENRVTLDYGNMAKEAFRTRRSPRLRIFAKPALIVSNICVIGLQLGFCGAFYIFVVDHSKEVIDHIFSTNLSRGMLFFVALPFFLLVGSIRNLIILSWIGLVGNVLLVTSMTIILVKMILMEHFPLTQLPAFTSIEGATLSAGSIIYAYAAQGVVLPLENKMKKPKEMLGFFGVISTSSTFIFVVYTATGFLGYITYGAGLKGSITLNLTNSPIDFTVKIMLLVMTYCGFPIDIYPVVEMFWPFVKQRFEGAGRCKTCLLRYALQYAAVFVAFGLAYAIPNFKDIIPFIGITSGMMLALILPPILEIVVFVRQWRKGSVLAFLYNITHNIFYLILGIIFIVVGLYSNYRNLSQSRRTE